MTGQRMGLQEMYAVCRAEQGACGGNGAISPDNPPDDGFAQRFDPAHLPTWCLPSWELDPGNDEDLTVKEMADINSYIKLVHANLGHPNNRAFPNVKGEGLPTHCPQCCSPFQVRYLRKSKNAKT